MEVTREQVEHYRRNGYLVLKRLISADALRTYDERFMRLVGGEVELPPAMKVMQDVMVVKGAVHPQSPAHAVNKLLCLENDDVLFDFVRTPGLVAAVQCLLDASEESEESEESEGRLYSLASNIFNKPPGVDGRHPMHQDLRYFKLGPASRIIGVWTAMLPATRKTGCLSVLPKSHELGLMTHAGPDWEYVNFGFHGVSSDIDLSQRVHIELDPGDTLFFHPLLVHGSGRNRSDGFRRAISVHYAAGDCVTTHHATADHATINHATTDHGRTDGGQSIQAAWKTNPQTRWIA
jgi:phytanoyl-CoA hydroxylase